MIRNIFKGIIALAGAAAGLALAEGITALLTRNAYYGLSPTDIPVVSTIIYVALGLIVGAVFLFLSNGIMANIVKTLRFFEAKLSAVPLSDIFFSVIGLITGLVIAFLFSTLTSKLPGTFLPLLVNLVLYSSLSYLGARIVFRHRHDINVPSWFKRSGMAKTAHNPLSSTGVAPKIIDTSVIIDGRIYDICRTGFLEGELVIPSFVLDELRHISDSPEALKRNRGRRGLDMLKRMQSDGKIRAYVRVDERDYDGIHEVDAKLLRLAGELGAVVLTMDYNLNKVASVQNVPVLNINDLVNAIKAIMLPGEELTVRVVQEGKEPKQGLAYLDDGTMIVIEGASEYVGAAINVCVTSVLQTSAGRMIFAKMATAVQSE